MRFGDVIDAAKALRACSVNLSNGGLCLRSKTPREVGEVLLLDLTVQQERLALEAVVAWVRGDAVGVRFVNLRADQRSKLEAMAKTLTEAPAAT